MNTPVSLVVYDSNGAVVKELTNLDYSVGTHKVEFDASSLNSGIYYYTLKAADWQKAKKMMLMK